MEYEKKQAECDKIKAECEKLKKNLGHIIRQKSIELIKKAFPEIGIVIIPLHNSLKNFENIGHWNKYP